MELQQAKEKCQDFLRAAVLQTTPQTTDNCLALGSVITYIELEMPFRGSDLWLVEEVIAPVDFDLLKLLDLVFSKDQDAEYELSVLSA